MVLIKVNTISREYDKKSSTVIPVWDLRSVSSTEDRENFLIKTFQTMEV